VVSREISGRWEGRGRGAGGCVRRPTPFSGYLPGFLFALSLLIGHARARHRELSVDGRPLVRRRWRWHTPGSSAPRRPNPVHPARRSGMLRTTRPAWIRPRRLSLAPRWAIEQQAAVANRGLGVVEPLKYRPGQPGFPRRRAVATGVVQKSGCCAGWGRRNRGRGGGSAGRGEHQAGHGHTRDARVVGGTMRYEPGLQVGGASSGRARSPRGEGAVVRRGPEKMAC